jgi:hypothetical protein
MEFKESPGIFYIFPNDAPLEFIPATDRNPSLINAAFRYFHPQKPNQSKQRHDIITIIITNPTTAIREGLGIDIKSNFNNRSSSHSFNTSISTTTPTPTSPTTLNATSMADITATTATMATTGRQHNLSTYSEDPSEILGSGKQSSNHGNGYGPSNTSTTKRKVDSTVSFRKFGSCNIIHCISCINYIILYQLTLI